ncbi:MAG: hypothetical protein ACFCU8_13810 [Thermosynechococcaceae cyanobacterium]
MKIKMAALMALLGFSTLLGACQSETTPTDTESPATEVSPEAPAAEETPAPQ